MKIRSLDDLILLASGREGECLSKEFTHQMSNHSWRCKKGHTFDMSPFLVSGGAWCSQCSKRKTPEEHLQWLQDYASERGGKCISTVFKRKAKMKFECAEGHQWELLPTTIMYDQTWCKQCAGLSPLGIDDMKKIAIEKGGLCLSKIYKDRNSKLRWKCAEGHTFEYSQRMIQRGLWCKKCNDHKKCLEALELMKKWAEEREGKCLSTTYVNNEHHLVWECKNGHKFKKNRDQVKQLNASNWCGKCSVLEKDREREIKMLKKIHQFAVKKGGKCLSDKYQNPETVLKFVCSKGHRWKTKAHNIVFSQSWCPKCNMERLKNRGKAKA